MDKIFVDASLYEVRAPCPQYTVRFRGLCNVGRVCRGASFLGAPGCWACRNRIGNASLLWWTSIMMEPSGLTSARRAAPLPPPAVCDGDVPWLWVCRWLKWRKQATELIVQRAGTHLGLLLGSDSHTKQGAGAGFGALW